MPQVLVAALAVGLLRGLADVPWTYLALWCALAAVSVALVALSRTRWAQKRPLHKCAMLSLIVHLAFACVAMTVRVFVGEGTGDGSGPPIRVRIIDDSSQIAAVLPLTATASDAVAAPDLLEPPPEPEPPAERSSPATDQVVENDQPPVAEVDQPEASQKSLETVADAVPAENSTEPVADQLPSASPESNTSPLPSIAHSSPETATASDHPISPSREAGYVTSQPAASAAALEPLPPEYALRSAVGRLGWVESQGGNVRTEAAVAAALQWLAAAQSADGSWDADRFGAGREMAVLGHNRYGAGRNADVGISALALLAFLGAGHSQLQGDYQAVVRRGLDALIRAQATDGSIFGGAEMYAQMYCHSMATFALAEAAAMTRDERLKPTVSRAVAFSLRAQHPSTGGWRYRPGDSGDTSQLGWQMMALASAQRAGMAIPASPWSGVERFLRGVQRGERGGLASYRPDSPASTSMTAEALYCRLLLAELLQQPMDEDAAAEATAHLLGALPDGDRVNLYYWYYATLALHHRQQANDQAAAAWHAWNDALTAVLLSKQVASGPDAGSWNADCLWGGYGGRVYTTAMSTMCLEVYYRYAPAPPRSRWFATRPETTDRPR